MHKVWLYKMDANQDCISITCYPVRVSWTNCGEGINGDFDPHDPTDENLLRFDVSVNIEGEWVEKESRCTNFPANATLREKKCALEFIFNEFYMALADDPTVSVKVLADIMSHIAPDCYPSTKMLATPEAKRVAGIENLSALGQARKEKHEFFVDTPVGKLKVQAKGPIDEPDDYPGVYVELVDKNGDSDLLACVEFDSNRSNLQTCIYQPGVDEPVEVITHEPPEEKVPELSFSAPWSYDGYEDWPLICVRIPELECDQATELIKWFDVQYGNTNQDVSEWAVEFQILIRNLTHDGFLLVNPRRLQVDEVADQLEDILTDKQLSIYEQARRLSREELVRLAAEQNG